MRQEEIEYVTDIGLALSSEKDFDVLLELILKKVMDLTHCDGGTLYLLNEEQLEFRVMCTKSMNLYQGSRENPCTLPPVALNRGSVSALAVLEDHTIVIDDVYQCQEYDLSGPIRYDGMTGYHTQSILVVVMKDRYGNRIGVLQLINAQDENGTIIPFAPEYIRIVESVASQAAVTIENMRYLEAIQELFRSLVRVFSAAVDARTPYNATHTSHMAEYGERFLTYLNQLEQEKCGVPMFSEEQRREILMSIWLHDIGKLVTPLRVMNKAARLLPEEELALKHRLEMMRLKVRIQELEKTIADSEAMQLYEELDQAVQLIEQINQSGFLDDAGYEEVKQLSEKRFRETDGTLVPWITEEEYRKLSIRRGTLTEEERQIMERHVVMTDHLLSQISFTPDLAHVRTWAASHHELLNGTGYPEHKTGEEIPKEVRIITILDIFDALVASDRPYKKGMPVDKALSILDTMANKEGTLDPELTKLFMESHSWEAG